MQLSLLCPYRNKEQIISYPTLILIYEFKYKEMRLLYREYSLFIIISWETNVLCNKMFLFQKQKTDSFYLQTIYLKKCRKNSEKKRVVERL